MPGTGKSASTITRFILIDSVGAHAPWHNVFIRWAGANVDMYKTHINTICACTPATIVLTVL